MERMKFGGETSRLLKDIPALKKALTSLTAPEMKPSAIYYILEHHRVETIRAAALVTDSLLVRERLMLYLSTLRSVETSLNGDDLKKMGVAQGKKIGTLLKALKEAKLNGEVKTREAERKLVRKWLTKAKR